MLDRYGFLFMAVVLFALGLYATVNPHRAKREQADFNSYAKMFWGKFFDVRYFEGGLTNWPLSFFRVIGIVTMAMSGFFAYLFWKTLN
jgi:hypothetical protein